MKKQTCLVFGIFLAGLLVSCGKPAPISDSPQATPTHEPSSIPEPTPVIHTIAGNVNPSNSGSITPLDGLFEEGSEVTLHAESAVGYAFSHWSGDGAGDSPTVDLLMDSDKQITANFIKVPTLVQFDVGSHFIGHTSGSGNVLMDFDSDGDLDLIISTFDWPPPQDPRPTLAYRNDGFGNFTEATTEVFAGLPVEAFSLRHWAIADFNGDGLEDLMLAEQGQDHETYAGGPPNGGQSMLLIQNSAGQLIDETDQRLPQQRAWTHNLAAGDVDDDGDIDIYMCNIFGSGIGPQLYLNNGAGFFTADASRLPKIVANMQKKFTSSFLVDVDQDGDLDLVLGGHGGGLVSENFPFDAILLNDGSGYFSFAPQGVLPPRSGGSNYGTLDINSADFNKDGWPDLVLTTQAGYRDGLIQMLFNNGDGTFRDESSRINQDWSSIEIPDCSRENNTEPGPFFWAFIVDSNNDGWPDILFQDGGQFHLLYENSMGESFTAVENMSHYKLPENTCPRAIFPGDVDGDNVMDVVLVYPGQIQQVLLRSLESDLPLEIVPVVSPPQQETPTETDLACIDTPTPSEVGTTTLLFRDDFEDVLEQGWEWVREESERWNLAANSGFLQLTLEPEWYPRNILLRPAPEGNFEISTRVLFAPTSNFQSAGLLAYQDDDNLLRVGRAFCHIPAVPWLCVGNGIYFDKAIPRENLCLNPNLETTMDSEAYLKLRREGNMYTAFYSEDGSTWILVGQHMANLEQTWIGLMTSGSSFLDVKADFDYFTVHDLP